MGGLGGWGLGGWGSGGVLGSWEDEERMGLADGPRVLPASHTNVSSVSPWRQQVSAQERGWRLGAALTLLGSGRRFQPIRWRFGKHVRVSAA